MSRGKKRSFSQFVGHYIRMIALLYIAYLILYFCFYAVSARRTLRQRQEYNASSASIYLEMVMGNISQIAFNLQSSPRVNSIMYAPLTASPDVYAEAYAEINKQVLQYDMLESCYLYIKSSETVLSSNEGKYDLAQFYDAPFLRGIAGQGARSISVHRPPARPLALVQGDVFTVSTRFSTVMRDNAGYLCLNISLARLREGLGAFADGGGILVSGKDGLLVGAGVQDFGAQEAFVTTHSLNAYGLQVSAVTGRAAFFEGLVLDFFKGSVFFFVFSLLAALVLTVLVTALNRTLRPMVYQLADLYKKQEAENNLSLDDFSFFFGELMKDRSDYSSRLEETAHVVRDKLLLDRLTGNIADGREFERLCCYMEVSFPHPWFVVVCVNIEGREEPQPPRENVATRALVRSLLERQGDPALYTTIDGDADVIGIANYSAERTGSMRALLEALAAEVRETLEERGTLNVFLTVSKPVRSPEEIPAAYARAKYNRGYKYTDISCGWYFEDETEDAAGTLVSDSLRRKAQSAGAFQASGALYECLSELMQEYENESGAQSLDVLRARLLVLAGMVLDGSAAGCPDAALHRCVESVQKLAAADSAGGLNSAFCAFLANLSRESPARRRPCDMNQYIVKALEFIDRSYSRDISVGDIAEHLNLNDKYFSRLFKERTGRTIMQHLSDLRMEKAEELLRGTDLTIREIGEMVGFGESRSFIRHFKKSYGTTPGEYRAQRRTTPLRESV